MTKIKNNIMRLRQVMKGNCVVLIVKDDKLIVDAGNNSAEDVKHIASTFFKSAYKLTTSKN